MPEAPAIRRQTEIIYTSPMRISTSIPRGMRYPYRGAVLLLLALLLTRGALFIPGVSESDWVAAGVKLVVFAVVYVAVLLLGEWRQLRQMATGVAGIGFGQQRRQGAGCQAEDSAG